MRATVAFIAAITFTAANAAACDSKPARPPTVAASARSATPTMTASSAEDPAIAAARTDVLNRYRGLRAAYDRAELAADPHDEDLRSYLEAPLKQIVIVFLTQMQQHGAVYRGTLLSSPTVEKIDLSAAVPTAVVADCSDATHWLLYYTKTNKPVPIKSGSRRYIIETTAEKFPGRGWLFVKSQSFPERSC